MHPMSRRDLLVTGAAGAAAMAFPRTALLGQEAYGGFRMGLHTSSLRAFDLDGALARIQELGLQYVEFSPRHFPLPTDADRIAACKEKGRKHGLTIGSWGAITLTSEHERNKAVFESAKALGIAVLVANPAPDSFESLERLTREFGVKIAIHNHGPEDKRYGKIEQVQKAIAKWPEAIGACVDTGHYLRFDEDPVQAIRTFGSRVHDVHLKDAKGPQEMTVLGRGRLDIVGTLKALKGLSFGGVLALEYELNKDNPMADLQECLSAVRAAAKQL